jgi:heptose II phosphotransferase
MIRGRILKAYQKGWRLQWREDSVDYPRLLDDFQAGRLTAERLSTGSAYREVYRLTAGGRRYVVKRDWEVDPRLEKKVWDWLAGTPYDRLIRLTSLAVSRGCREAQDVYLVAEKLVWGRCREAWMIAEYVEGEALIREYANGRPAHWPDVRPYILGMAETLGRIHDYGLASNDFHPGNFIRTEDGGLRIIDLAVDGPLIICQANDALTMMHFFQVRPPIHGWLSWLAFKVMLCWRGFKNFSRRVRGRGRN